jgi:hypothetical protein
MKKMFYTLLFALCANASASEFQALKMRLSGCYVGLDVQGNEVVGKVEFVNNPIGPDLITLAKNGIAASYLNIIFYIPSKNESLVTQVFSDGKILDTQILNNRISYSESSILEKYISGQLVYKFKNRAMLTAEFNQEDTIFHIYQNDNKSFLQENYGSNSKSGIVELKTSKVSCLNLNKD